jgi:hypothetical protein
MSEAGEMLIVGWVERALTGTAVAHDRTRA